MSEQEKEMRREPEAEVEGHLKRETDDVDESQRDLRRENDEPDVEGHLKR